jgi:hypothetical protein
MDKLHITRSHAPHPVFDNRLKEEWQWALVGRNGRTIHAASRPLTTKRRLIENLWYAMGGRLVEDETFFERPVFPREYDDGLAEEIRHEVVWHL